MSEARDQLRAKLLATKVPKAKVIDFFGEKIEIRQLTLGSILSARDETDNTARIVNTLVLYAFVPGTNEHVFEEGDADQLKTLPFGQDMLNVTNAIQELTQVNFLEPKPDSNSTESSSSSTGSPGSSG